MVWLTLPSAVCNLSAASRVASDVISWKHLVTARLLALDDEDDFIRNGAGLSEAVAMLSLPGKRTLFQLLPTGL